MLHLVGISFLNHKMMGQIKEAKKLWQDGIAKNITFIVGSNVIVFVTAHNNK